MVMNTIQDEILSQAFMENGGARLWFFDGRSVDDCSRFASSYERQGRGKVVSGDGFWNCYKMKCAPS